MKTSAPAGRPSSRHHFFIVLAGIFTAAGAGVAAGCPRPPAEIRRDPLPAVAPGFRAVANERHHFWFQVPITWVRRPPGEIPSVAESWRGTTRDVALSVILVSSESASAIVKSGVSRHCDSIAERMRVSDPTALRLAVTNAHSSTYSAACTFQIEAMSDSGSPRVIIHRMMFSAAGTVSLVIDMDRLSYVDLMLVLSRIVGTFSPL